MSEFIREGIRIVAGVATSYTNILLHTVWILINRQMMAQNYDFSKITDVSDYILGSNSKSCSEKSITSYSGNWK